MSLFKLTHTPNFSAGAANLQRVCWLRGILVFVETVCLLLACEVFSITLPLYDLFLVIMFNLVMISFTGWCLRYNACSITNRTFFLQLLMDVVSLSLFLYLTGGYTNPLVSLLLIPTSIGAALLPERYSWSLSAAAIIAYSCLMIWYQPLTSGMDHALSRNDQQMISFHLVGMWASFVISALLINYFVIRMASTLRKQQATIATAREHQLQSENILAIAIQAAGAAHELGTPLATMAVILSDIQEEYSNNHSFSEDISLLQSQVQECKQRLRQLVHKSQHTQTEAISVNDFINRIVDQWQLLRPTVSLKLSQIDSTQSEEVKTSEILCAPSLYQAIIALLDNAADASPDSVRLTLQRIDQNVVICIEDQGEGIPVTIAEQSNAVIHTPNISAKDSGLGLGLLLSQASIEHLGGQVRLYNRTPCGTRIEIHLPLKG